MYEIAGVHHVAIGVEALEPVKVFYKDVLGFNFEKPPEAPKDSMSGIMRGVVPEFDVAMLSQGKEGVIVELIKMINPIPRAIRHDFSYGDIGANKVTIAVSDVNKIYRKLKDKVNFCSSPKSVELPGFGDYNFVYCKDPESNLIELASGAKLPVKDEFGGVRWVGISVTDLNRSVSFYQKHAGFDTLFVKPHENFSRLVDEVSGNKQTKVRSCILASSRGGGMVELFEVLEPRGRSIPSYTLWGDFSYLQVAMMCKNVPEIADRFEKEGLDFVLKLQLMSVETRAGFTYIQDPDGIALEFLSFGDSD
jgi:catechol 2,3-dioxygenase-like lactoylglutathione lyase family enzyme